MQMFCVNVIECVNFTPERSNLGTGRFPFVLCAAACLPDAKPKRPKTLKSAVDRLIMMMLSLWAKAQAQFEAEPVITTGTIFYKFKPRYYVLAF